AIALDDDALAAVAAGLGMALEDVRRLNVVWGKSFASKLGQAAATPKRFAVRLLAGSLVDYRRATSMWWQHLSAGVQYDVEQRPMYFISSNMHSLVNPLSGFALRHEAELVRHIETAAQADLVNEFRDIEARHVPSSRENFLYYVLKKYVRTPEGAQMARDRLADEETCGIHRASSAHSFEVDAEFIELKRLKSDWLDPRLRIPGVECLADSDAIIVNIDYPLGMAAQIIFAEIAGSSPEIRGVYVLGKAATLNGAIGDVTIPNVVHDEHSRNTYLFNNCFTAADVSPHLVYGTALDNQKAVSVRGTFLQNSRYMDVFYREGYTAIEMEGGPYLSAVFEAYRPTRYPTDEIVNLYGLPFDLGLLHYASDTPLSKGKNLGAANLSYFGMDPTYATSVAILRRIFTLEIQRLVRHNSGEGCQEEQC
ncbi:MAG: hypothetical protein HY260_23495, partial [Chloroflexi bacterium]|nr:hypothetical protein [Chloroflexota bacterium]